MIAHALKVRKMAFKRFDVPDEDDFYKSLMKEAQNVSILDVGELYESDDKENQAYLFPLLSFVSGIEDGEIHCTKTDIDDALKGKTFKMKAKRQKGKQTWYKLIPLASASVE